MDLHDGVSPVRKMAIFGLLHNCKTYLEGKLFEQLTKWEERYPSIQFFYYFLENNSTDGTRESLQGFLKDRCGSSLFIDNLPTYSKGVEGIHVDRITRLCNLRNQLLRHMRTAPEFKEMDWTVLIDSDVLFEDDLLDKLFSYKPKSNDIVMLCPYALEVNKKETAEKKFGKAIVERLSNSNCEYITLGHYYDSFAITYKDQMNSWPHCRFQRCIFCAMSIKQANISPIPSNEDLVDVRSAFGGFGLVDAKALQDERVYWDLIYFYNRKFPTCEHILFCEKLRTTSGKSIKVATKVDILCLN